jgi:isopenicillin N synthase-like dioxygenase
MRRTQEQVVETQDGVVLLEHADLAAGVDLGASIERAFGPEGIGLLVVRGVPGFPELRQALLPLGHRFASLPHAVKEKYVDAASSYAFGWSHGKELLRPGQPDGAKGSYYANPQLDDPQNLWPAADLPELEGAFKALGRRMVEAGLLVAAQCDRYVQSRLGERLAPEARLERIISESRACKARLLHYFPIDDGDPSPRARDSWCGWHSDHGSLTALCPAMYFEEAPGHSGLSPEGTPPPVRSDFPPPDALVGLYVRTRAGGERKVAIPRDCVAFQIGESAQVMTGGLLQATPHAVQALAWPTSRNVSRSTYAVFMQPDDAVPMHAPEGTDPRALEVGAFKPGMTFGEFAAATFARFYDPFA